MASNTSSTLKIVLLAALMTTALFLGGCRRDRSQADSSATPLPTLAEQAGADPAGDELDALLQELEQMNNAADPLDDLETLDDLTSYDPADELDTLLADLESMNNADDPLDDLATLDSLFASYDPAGDELDSLLGGLDQMNAAADPLNNLNEIP